MEQSKREVAPMRKPITKRKKKSGLIHKLKRFLASDSHMNDKKLFFEKVHDYLISDMHMYAALLSPHPIAPHLDASTRVWYTRKLTTQKMTVENRQWPGRNSIQQNDEGKDSAMGTSQNQSTQGGTSRKRTVYRNGHIPPS